MHSERFAAARATSLARFSLAGFATLLLAGCGSNYRPVVSAINPVGPAGQLTKYAVAISNPCGATATTCASPGLVTLIDYSGDTILNTTAIGVSPQYLILSTGGGTGYTINGDGTVNTFAVSTGLLSTNVTQTTLPANAGPVSILPQGINTYIAEAQLGGVGQLQGTPPAQQQLLPTGMSTIYTVGVQAAPRVYAIVPGAAGAAGKVSAIEATTNTISSTIGVGVNPVYGVMSADGARAFILNHGSNTVSVVNAQTNALDTFTTAAGVSSTVPVGVGPIWADFAPTLAEMVVANQGNGTTPGSLTIVNIPRCASTTLVTNPACDPADPLDALGFGQVLATIPVGVNPVMVAVLQDGTRAYVANAGNAALGIAGSVSVVNLTTNTVTATLPATASTNEGDTLVHGHPAYIAATTGAPTGKVYVTSLDSSDITIIRTDTDTVQTHLSLQGSGIAVRVTTP